MGFTNGDEIKRGFVVVVGLGISNCYKRLTEL